MLNHVLIAKPEEQLIAFAVKVCKGQQYGAADVTADVVVALAGICSALALGVSVYRIEDRIVCVQVRFSMKHLAATSAERLEDRWAFGVFGTIVRGQKLDATHHVLIDIRYLGAKV